MSYDPGARNVVVLAPMPLEMNAIVATFGLEATSNAEGAPWTGRVGGSAVTAIHIGMGPAVTRAATSRLFDPATRGAAPVEHVMIAGICGGLDPDLDVGTVINPEVVLDQASGATYRHIPPGDVVQAGKLVTTETVSFDRQLSESFFEDGCVGVDMETSAVAEVCEAQGCAWSVYRCIGDRHFDGLLDERVVALSNPDGSGNRAEIERILASEPEIVTKLERLSHDATLAAHRAAEAALRGCIALDH